jgi:hypothetical protein
MTRLEIESKIKLLRAELENRHRHGIVKLAANGVPIPVEVLQAELYSLIYKKSKLDSEDSD